MTTPHDPGPAAAQERRQAGRLRVMDEHDVARAHGGGEVPGVVLEHRLVVAVFVLAERAAVPLTPVEVVVEPLGDLEEAGIALDHQPAGVDAGTANVRQQHAEHLGDAPARGRRVEAHDGRAGKPLTQPLAVIDETVDAIAGHDLGEQPRVLRREHHFVHRRSCPGSPIEPRPSIRSDPEPVELGLRAALHQAGDEVTGTQLAAQ